MNSTPSKRVLITGANTGLGKDLARQLAARDEFDLVILACRDEAKGYAAKDDLERTTGRSVFAVIQLDVSDLGSVGRAVQQIGRPLDALVMNAGGMGGPTPMALTADGVTEMFASNVLGHVALLDRLLAADMLTEVAVLVGSEAARGVPKLRIPRPSFESHSTDEFSSVIDGSFFRDRKLDPGLAYGQVKYLAALWMAARAAERPDLRFITMSPGNTSGTEAMRDLPTLKRILVSRVVLPYLGPLLGLAHPLKAGSERLVQAVTDPSLVSGTFYASAADALTGPVIDQAEIIPELRDVSVQHHAEAAIRRFVAADSNS